MEAARPLSERPFDQLLGQAITARADGFVALRDRECVRHGVWIESGYVVGVHVAGHYDPLLELLRRQGALSASLQRRCVLAIASSRERCGVLARELAGVPSSEVRAALSWQLVERFKLLSELTITLGHDARLERCAVPLHEHTLRMPLGSLRRRAGAPSVNSAPEPDGAAARRVLRGLAKRLHPDLHPQLDAAQREQLAHELACATAAYHGFS